MSEDVLLMKELGLQSYRFSISWPRILPQGRGTVNQKGLDFYDRLVDELLRAGVLPNATLYHWDLPQALQEAGGWPNRDSTDWFIEYAQIVFDRLADRVEVWSTHNEPWAVAFAGHAFGAHAPGICDYSLAYQTAHHLLLSHGKTVQLFRQGGYQGEIGIVLSVCHYLPATETDADRAACQRVVEESTDLFSEPLFVGRYPEGLFDWIGSHQPRVQPGDLELIGQPLDFLGITFYVSEAISYDPAGSLLKAHRTPVSAPGWGRTEMGWGINPPGLLAVLLDVHQRYRPPKIYILESGCALVDTPDETGFVADWSRVDYLRAHLRFVLEAIGAGVPVRGYYVWSFLDNFEWAMGFGPRFGLVRVEHDSQLRIPKQSARWYSEVIRYHGIGF
jgi:beta-glucosidase